jgi:hypothetical protein
MEKIIARNICDGLERISPENKAYFEANLATFDAKIDFKMKQWQAAMTPYKEQSLLPTIMSGYILKSDSGWRLLILWSRNPEFLPRLPNL